MYCVFWYPGIFHTSFENRKREPHLKRIDISDDVDDTSFRCYLDIKEDSNGNLCFNTYRLNINSDGEKSDEEKLDLFLRMKSNNGFVVYQFDDKVDGKHRINFVKYYHIFYHHAKSLHHSHEINHEADSFLRPMFIKEDFCLDQTFMGEDDIGRRMIKGYFRPKDILTRDNLAFSYYLYQYERIFKTRYAHRLSTLRSEYLQCKSVEHLLINQFNDLKNSDKVEEIKSELQKIVECYRRYLSDYNGSINGSNGDTELDKIRTESLDLLPRVRKKMRGEVKELCENAYIEYTYCKTLLESKYNKQIRKDVQFDEKELDNLKSNECEEQEKFRLQKKDFLRKMAVNICSAMSYVDDVLIVCRDWDTAEVDGNFDKAEALSKRSEIIAKCSLVASIISLIVSIIGLIIAKSNVG